MDSKLLNYIEKGNPQPGTVRQMITRGAHVNGIDPNSNTILHLVMRHCCNKLEVVRVILNAGADIDAMNIDRKTPLLMAIEHCQDISVIIALIEHGANINCADKNNNTPLHFAVINERHSAIDVLLHFKADVSIRNSDGNSVVHLCVLKNDMQTLKKILQCEDLKIDIDAKNNLEETPLMSAVKVENLEIVRELLLVGASVRISGIRASTPLHAALKNSPTNMELVEELLWYNADVFDYDMDLLTPLHLALNKYYEKESDNLVFSKTLLKFVALRNGDRTDWISHHASARYDIIPELLKYYKMCLAEVCRMESELIHENISFYEFVIQGLNKRALLEKRIDYFTFNHILFVIKAYPIYRDIIVSCINKKYLSRKMMNIAFYTKQENGQKKFLDNDSVFIICGYLSNLEILNLIDAFSDFQP
ncbi:ANK_REP_REGION domain-containing protein [Nephila pilipes]|uniref:Alpha-latrotoxin n=1 Tax=Nephila pilipes TaxID=299642 RepID=A0A8X6N346_NEPPI|nr:ANK_REP_REGION domain-containing protein [Nephila pilipes]